MYSLDELRALPQAYVRERLQARIADDERRGRERCGRSEYLAHARVSRRIVAEHRPVGADEGAACAADGCGQVWPCSTVAGVLAAD